MWGLESDRYVGVTAVWMVVKAMKLIGMASSRVTIDTKELRDRNPVISQTSGH